MIYNLFALLLTIFALQCIYLAWRSSKKIKTTTDYFLAGRQLEVLPITLTLMATQIGGGFLSGIAQESYHVGFYGILYALGISAGFIMLGLGIAGRLQELNISTTAELFETHYGSVALKKIASGLLLLSLWGILVAQIVAFKTITAGLGIENQWLTIIFWLALIIHTTIGGFHAVVSVDMLKQLFIVIIFSGIFLYSLFALPHPSLSWQNLFAIQESFKSYDLSFTNLLPIFLMPSLFCLIEQDLAQCFFAAKNKATAAKSAIFASIFLMLFSMAPVYFGMQTKLLNLAVPGIANPLIIYLQHITSEVIFIVALIALIAAITSTANSLLCAVSAHITQDFGFAKGEQEQSLLLSKSITFFTGIAALITSHFVSPNILEILITSYELSVSCLFVPLIIAYFTNNVKNNAAVGAMLAGAFGFVLFRFIPIPFPHEIVTLGMSLVGYYLGNSIKK